MSVTAQACEHRDQAQGHKPPAEAHLLFEQSCTDIGGVPDTLRDSTEHWMLDGRNEVAPPFRAVPEQVVARERKSRSVDDHGASRVPRVGGPADGDDDKAADCDREVTERPWLTSGPEEPVSRD